MSRSLTTAIKNELSQNKIRPVHLITINFDTPVNLTDCSFSLTSSVSGSSVTYTASDFVLGITNFTEEVDITKSSIGISLSGADQTFISTVLNESVINDEVIIYRGLLDANNALIVGMELPSTVVFDYPSVGALTGFIVSQMIPDEPCVETGSGIASTGLGNGLGQHVGWRADDSVGLVGDDAVHWAFPMLGTFAFECCCGVGIVSDGQDDALITECSCG